MNAARPRGCADPELVELFDGEPELLAIADAIAATASASDVRPPRLLGRRGWLLVACVVAAAAVAGPALALSSAARELVGLQTSPGVRPALVARVTAIVIRGPHRPGTPVTVRFTVGEQGKPPGTGVPAGSVFSVLIVPTTGRATQLVAARGGHGRYEATGRLSSTGIRQIQIGGFLNVRHGPSPANGGFWIPVIVVTKNV